MVINFLMNGLMGHVAIAALKGAIIKGQPNLESSRTNNELWDIHR